MGGVPSKPKLYDSSPRLYVLKSPWDRIRFDRDLGGAPSFHSGFPTAVDPRAFRTTGGEPNVRSIVRPAFASLAMLTSESDVAVCSGDRAAARRVLHALDFWARSDAFRGSSRVYHNIAEYGKNPPICDLTGDPWNIEPPDPVRAWSDTYIQLGPNGYGEPFFLSKMATGAAVAFLQIRNAVSLRSEEVQRIKAWFRGDLMKFQREFAILCFQARRVTDHVGRPLPKREMMLWGWEGAHNKVYCSLLAVTALAIAADDEASFRWAMEAFDFVLNQIEEDGTHRATLYEKGNKALLYHNFMTDTIVPLAVLADANGHQFLTDSRLTRLIRRVVSSLDEPAYFERMTGLPQEYGRFKLAGTSGWAVMYSAYVGHPNVVSVASSNSVVYPLFAGSGRRYGGHPKVWHPSTVSPAADWIGLAIFYACVLGIALTGFFLSVANWLRGRRFTAVFAWIPIVWPLAVFCALRPPRAESWWTTTKKEITRRELLCGIAVPTLLLATLATTGIGFAWTYLLLRII